MQQPDAAPPIHPVENGGIARQQTVDATHNLKVGERLVFFFGADQTVSQHFFAGLSFVSLQELVSIVIILGMLEFRNRVASTQFCPADTSCGKRWNREAEDGRCYPWLATSFILLNSGHVTATRDRKSVV